MYRLFLAARYLWSRPISWVSVVGIWLSVTALICTVGIMTGFLGELRRVIRGTTSDLILTPIPRSYDGQSRVVPPYRVIENAVSGMAGVAAVSPHLWRAALLAEPSNEGEDRVRVHEGRFVQIVGVDPTDEFGVTDFARFVEEASERLRVADVGAPFSRGASTGGRPIALIGEELATEAGLAKGDTITLLTVAGDASDLPGQSEQAIPVFSETFEVGGTVRTGEFDNDRRTVFLDLDTAQSFLRTPGGASEICVRVEEGVELDALADQVRRRLRSLSLLVQVETWRDRHAARLIGIENQRSILACLLFFFVLVACFNVFATLTILVSDKVRDIGILNAIGTTTAGIAGLFVTCAILMTLVGGLLGCVSGVLAARNINLLNDGIETLTGVRIFRPDIYLFERIPVDVEPWFVAIVFGSTLVLAVASALLPAVRAARKSPVDALRYE